MPNNTDQAWAKLGDWVRLLGWRSRLRRYQHVLEDDSPHRQEGKVLTWFETGKAMGGRTDCFLQINEFPQGQTLRYSAAVYAIRFRLFSGWHVFRLSSRDEALRREAEHLGEWLHHRWFTDLDGRRAFRKAHPQCSGYTWTRIAQEHPRHWPGTRKRQGL